MIKLYKQVVVGFFLVLVLGCSHSKSSNDTTNLYRIDYEGFTLWMDCSKRAVVNFRYNAQRDSGSFERSSSFYKDSSVPASCQQFSTDSYKVEGERWDRGHMVPANHLDASQTAIRQSNFMTNILPQAANMNRGAWLATEEIVECYRDIDELLVLGGALWQQGKTGQQFLKSHGVETPSSFWKVIIKGDGTAQAWLIPNSDKATRKQLDSYLIDVGSLEKITGVSVPVDESAKKSKAKKSWVLPKGCDKG